MGVSKYSVRRAWSDAVSVTGRMDRAAAATLSFVLLTLFPLAGFASNALAEETRELCPELRTLLAGQPWAQSSVATRPGSTPDAIETSTTGGPDRGGPENFEAETIPCFLLWDEDSPLDLPTHARVVAPGMATARLTFSEIREIASAPELRALQAAKLAQANLDVSRRELGVDLVHAVEASGAYRGLTGQGVVVGVIDTGVDLTHPDFTDEQGLRIHSVWDQTDPTPAPPSSFSYGREWSRNELMETSQIAGDPDGHGTHVLSIAGGNGEAGVVDESDRLYTGIAPEAHLVVVKTDFWTTSIVDGIDYVFRQADALDLPAVVNLSLGHHYGPHDGTEVLDLAINALVSPGRLVVAAAGNEREDGIHAEASVGADKERITLAIPPYIPTPAANNDVILIDGYYDAGSRLSLTISTPSGAIVGPVEPGQWIEESTPDGWVKIENDVFDPITDDRNLYVQIYDRTAANPPRDGTWTIELSPLEENNRELCTVDFWLYLHTLDPDSAPRFALGESARKLIASPASADSVIAVTAYVSRNSWASVDGNGYSYNPPPTIGSIAPFSSPGPRRDGVLKPDVAAPGMGVVAALSAHHRTIAPWIVPGGRHVILQGTSMAAPHVTGVIALLFESLGTLSRHEVLEQLHRTSRSDPFTGEVPNSEWGLGKMDVVAATASVSSVTLRGFSAERQGNSVDLRWSVPPAFGDLRFRIERSASPSSFHLPSTTLTPIPTFGARSVSTSTSTSTATATATAISTSNAMPPSESASRVFVAEVGPGPDYTFVDELANAEDIEYWLTPVDGEKAGPVHGPFLSHSTANALTFALSRPFPNPTRGELKWNVALPSVGPLRIELYDPQGRRVRTLFDELLPEGNHTLSWQGPNDGGEPLGSGVYWVRANFGDAQDTKRVLLLR